MRSIPRVAALATALALALALGAAPQATVGRPAQPAAAGTAPEALPSLSCMNCIDICLLRSCGFSEPPTCVSAKLPGCQMQCASSCP